MKRLQRYGEIFFFVPFRQGVKRNLEGRKSDIGRAAYQFKINRVFALYAFGKQLVAQQCNFMRQPMVPVVHAVNAAFQYFVTATELLRVLQHVLFDLTRRNFRLPFLMTGTRTNR